MDRPNYILVLDDERELKEVTENDIVTHVEHSWDAIKDLRERAWHEVWLDFDLGGDDKGSNVCRYIRDQHPRDSLLFTHTKFYIHSFNTNGRMSMQHILRDAGITAIMTDLVRFRSKPRATSFA